MSTPWSDRDIQDLLRKQAYIHFNKEAILALEELFKRYRLCQASLNTKAMNLLKCSSKETPVPAKPER